MFSNCEGLVPGSWKSDPHVYSSAIGFTQQVRLEKLDDEQNRNSLCSHSVYVHIEEKDSQNQPMTKLFQRVVTNN